MTKSIKARLSELENQTQDKPLLAIFQDWDNPDLWYIGGPRKGEPVTWDQVEANYSGYQLIRVVYEIREGAENGQDD